MPSTEDNATNRTITIDADGVKSIETSPSPSKSPKSPKSHKRCICTKKIYFFIYALIYGFHGCLLSLPGTIYIELQNELQTSSKTISWIYSSMAISAGISAFISGYIMDKFVSTHKYLAICVLFEVIALSLIPFTTNILLMFILFIFIGIGYSAIDTCCPVFIFRIYPINGQHIFFITQTILSITSMTFPLFIQLSINKTDHYYYPLFVLAICGLVFVIFSSLLPTPEHDELRTIKRKISKMTSKSDENIEAEPEDNTIDDLAREASSRLDDNKIFKRQQHIIIGILVITMLIHSMIENGANSFITTYVSQHLELNEAYGRYLISVYWGSNLLYRLITVALHRLCGIKITPMYAILNAFCVRLIMIAVIWIIFAKNHIGVLFAVFIINGFFCSPTFPGLCQWTESVVPMNGAISCMFMVGYQSGIAIITPVLGDLMEIYSPKILPFVLLGPVVIGFFIVISNVVIYKRFYKKHINREIRMDQV